MTKKKPTQEQQKKTPMIRAMVWYKEEHFEQLLEIFDDAHLLPRTYKDWLSRAVAKKDELTTTGDQVIKVFIDPVTFPEWCKKKELKKDANSRSQLAIEVAQAQSFNI